MAAESRQTELVTLSRLVVDSNGYSSNCYSKTHNIHVRVHVPVKALNNLLPSRETRDLQTIKVSGVIAMVSARTTGARLRSGTRYLPPAVEICRR